MTKDLQHDSLIPVTNFFKNLTDALFGLVNTVITDFVIIIINYYAKLQECLAQHYSVCVCVRACVRACVCVCVVDSINMQYTITNFF